MAPANSPSERKVAIELFKQATAKFNAGRLDLACRLAQRSREIFLQIPDYDGACAAASLEGRVALRAAKPQDAWQCFSWACDEAQRRGLQSRALTSLTELATLCELGGDLAQAVAMHRQVLHGQRERDDNIGIAVAAGNVGRLLPRLKGQANAPGDPIEGARVLLAESLSRFRQAGHGQGTANALICFGDIERASGDLDSAAAAFAEAAELSKADAPMLPLALLAHLNLGHIARDRGDVLGAARHFDLSLDAATKLGDRQGQARARLGRVMATVDLEPLQASIDELQKIESDFNQMQQPGGAVTAAVNRAALLCRLGQLHEGAQLLRHSRQILQNSGDGRAAQEVSLSIAEIALAQGDVLEVHTILNNLTRDSLHGRLKLRLDLLQTRVFMRELRLDEALNVLANLPDMQWSESEKFATALALCELDTLRGVADAWKSLENLRERVEHAAHPREFAAAILAAAHHAALRFRNLDARSLTQSALATWARMGEPLGVCQAELLLMRLELQGGAEISELHLNEIENEFAKAGVVEGVYSSQLVRATLQARSGLVPPNAAAEPIQKLRDCGHEAAALIGFLWSASILGDETAAIVGDVWLDSTAVAAPIWWQKK